MDINTRAVKCFREWLCDYQNREPEQKDLVFKEWHKDTLRHVEYINGEWVEV